MLKICRHCGKHFESRWASKWCKDPECQKAKKKYHQSKNNAYQSRLNRKYYKHPRSVWIDTGRTCRWCHKPIYKIMADDVCVFEAFFYCHRDGCQQRWRTESRNLAHPDEVYGDHGFRHPSEMNELITGNLSPMSKMSLTGSKNFKEKQHG